MKYHALLLFLKKQQNLKLSSAANIGGALWVKGWHFHLISDENKILPDTSPFILNVI